MSHSFPDAILPSFVWPSCSVVPLGRSLSCRRTTCPANFPFKIANYFNITIAFVFLVSEQRILSLNLMFTVIPSIAVLFVFSCFIKAHICYYYLLLTLTSVSSSNYYYLLFRLAHTIKIIHPKIILYRPTQGEAICPF